MKRNLSILTSVFSVILLIFLFSCYETKSEYFEIIFYSIICAEILIIVLGFMFNSIFEEKENRTDSLQDFFSDTLEGEKSAVKKTVKEKSEPTEIVLNEISQFLQSIQAMAGILSEPLEDNAQIAAASLITKNIYLIKDLIGQKTSSADQQISEKDILLQLVQNVPVKENVENEISIGIYGEVNSYNLTLRLVLQSYGFFVRIFEHSQKALFAIEDNLIQMLIISPESENDEAFYLCKTIRKKNAVLEFPILMLVNKYNSYLMEKNFEGQINDFLVRPFDISALLERIQILENYRNLWLEKQELLKSEKEKSTFLYFVTHNVNTPLTILLNEIQKLQETAKTEKNEILLSEIQSIGDCSAQINIIIQNVLNSYRISDGRYLVNPKIINLEDFLLEENKFLIQKAKRKNQTFEFECNIKTPRVFCDENSLKGIYANLVDNAIKYTLPEGNIKVRIDADEESTFLHVIDDGAGIPEEKRKLLFKRFAGIGSKYGKNEHTVGLGLYVVNEISKLNGLELEYSENFEAESGSIFTVIFKRLG